MALSRCASQIHTLLLREAKLFFVILFAVALLGACSGDDGRDQQAVGESNARPAESTLESTIDPPAVDPIAATEGRSGTRGRRCSLGADTSTAAVLRSGADRLADSDSLSKTLDDLAAQLATGEPSPAALVELAHVIPEAHDALVEQNDPCAETFATAASRLSGDAPVGTVQTAETAGDSVTLAAAFGLSGDEATCVASRVAADADELAVLLAHSQCANGE